MGTSAENKIGVIQEVTAREARTANNTAIESGGSSDKNRVEHVNKTIKSANETIIISKPLIEKLKLINIGSDHLNALDKVSVDNINRVSEKLKQRVDELKNELKDITLEKDNVDTTFLIRNMNEIIDVLDKYQKEDSDLGEIGIKI